MASSLEAAVLSLSQGFPDAGYNIGTPEFQGRTLHIPLIEGGLSLEDAVDDFKTTISNAVNGAPTINVEIAYYGKSITLSPSTREKGHEDTEKFLRAYEMILRGASIRSIKSSILGASKNISKRQPQDIIIEILEILRGHEGGISQIQLEYRAMLSYPSVINYTKYLSEKGLIEIIHKPGNVTIKATEEGGRIELAPENFMDYMNESGRRTKIQIYRDIAGSINNHGGSALRTTILSAANLTYPQLIYYLTEMVGEGYIKKEMEEGSKNSKREVYMLTSKGASNLLGIEHAVETISIGEIVQEKRDSSDILISILSALRKADGSLLKTKASHLSNTITPQFERYLAYLLSHGLVEALEDKKPLTLTEKGWNIPLKPEQFMDYENRLGQRAKIQIYRDIAYAIYNHGGRALITHITNGARLSHVTAHYLDEMIKEGYISKFPLGKKQRGAYELTDDGKSRFPNPMVNGVESYSRRSGGEVLARILELAQDGSNKIGLVLGASIGFKQIDNYIGFLLKYNLILQSDSVFRATGLHGAIDKEILPYALELMLRENESFGLSRRTQQSIWSDILSLASEPINIVHFIKAFGGGGSTYRKYREL